MDYNTLINLYCWAFLLFQYLSILSTLRRSPCWGWARGSSPVRPHALRFAPSTVAAGTRPQPSLLQRAPHPTSLGPLLHTCRLHSSPSHTSAAGTGCAVNCGPRSVGATSRFPQPTLSQRRATPCLWGAAVLGRELCEPQSHDSWRLHGEGAKTAQPDVGAPARTELLTLALRAQQFSSSSVKRD